VKKGERVVEFDSTAFSSTWKTAGHGRAGCGLIWRRGGRDRPPGTEELRYAVEAKRIATAKAKLEADGARGDPLAAGAPGEGLALRKARPTAPRRKRSWLASEKGPSPTRGPEGGPWTGPAPSSGRPRRRSRPLTVTASATGFVIASDHWREPARSRKGTPSGQASSSRDPRPHGARGGGLALPTSTTPPSGPGRRLVDAFPGRRLSGASATCGRGAGAER